MARRLYNILDILNNILLAKEIGIIQSFLLCLRDFNDFYLDNSKETYNDKIS